VYFNGFENGKVYANDYNDFFEKSSVINDEEIVEQGTSIEGKIEGNL